MKYVFIKASVNLEKDSCNSKPKEYLVKVGYWHNPTDIEYPVPTDTDIIKTDFTPQETSKFLKLFNRIFKDGYGPIAYKGLSRCRFCGDHNGCREYDITKKDKNVVLHVKIPSGYLHYITEHFLRPPVQFFKYLDNNQLDKIIQILIPINKTMRWVGSTFKSIAPNPPEYTVY